MVDAMPHTEVTDTKAELRGCVSTNIRVASRVLTRYYDEVMSPSGLRVTQLATLAAIAYHGPFTLKVLARVLVMDRSTLTADLRPLEAQGFITIVPGEDRRTRVITVTERGVQAIETAMPLWRRAQAHVEQTLGKGRLGALLGELREVVAIAQKS